MDIDEELSSLKGETEEQFYLSTEADSRPDTPQK